MPQTTTPVSASWAGASTSATCARKKSSTGLPRCSPCRWRRESAGCHGLPTRTRLPRGRHLVPGAAVKLAAAGLGTVTAPLLEEVGHALLVALIPEIAQPLDPHTPMLWA